MCHFQHRKDTSPNRFKNLLIMKLLNSLCAVVTLLAAAGIPAAAEQSTMER